MPEEQAILHYERRPGFEPARAGNERLMKASWTYEVAPAGEGAAGLEEYLVETKDGEVAGKVVALVDRDGERFLLFDSGTPPIAKERRAARWDDIADIDHDTLAITLRTDLEKTLDVEPANEVEGEKADAVRVTDLPRELMPRVSPERGPTDRPPTRAGSSYSNSASSGSSRSLSRPARRRSLGSSRSSRSRRSCSRRRASWFTEAGASLMSTNFFLFMVGLSLFVKRDPEGCPFGP